MRDILTVCFILLCGSGVRAATESTDIENEFNVRFTAWTNYLAQSSAFYHSDARLYIETPFFTNIVELGIHALPFIIDKMEKDRSSTGTVLFHAVKRISKAEFERVYDKKTNKMTFPEFPDREPDEPSTVYWWKKGRFRTGGEFSERYADWRKLKGEGKDEEAQKAFRRITNLGLPVLPYLADEAEKEPAFVGAISKLTDGALPPDTPPSECKAWWEKNKARYELPPLQDAEKKSPPTPVPPAQAKPYAVSLIVGVGVLAGLLMALRLWKRR